jgi:oligopeptidase B
MNAPIAKKIPHIIENHGHERTDNYYWLNERENPEVIAYLEAENAYMNEMLGSTKDLQNEIFEEIKARIKQDDNSVPYKLMDYWYYTRYETGKEYPLYCRKKGNLAADEEILLDGNKEAEGKAFFQVMGMGISSDQNIMAFGVDTVGRRICNIYFKNLTTNELYADIIENATGNFVWASDNKTLLYTRQDEETLRWDKVFRHVLGDNLTEDFLVYEEEDDTFYVNVSKSKSREYIFIASESTVSDEYRYAPASNPTDFQLFQTRQRDFEYGIDHAGDYFYIMTNWNAQNFRLMKTPKSQTPKEFWSEIIPHDEKILIENFELFKNYLVVEQRKNGLTNILIQKFSDNSTYSLEMPEETYSIGLGMNPEYDTQTLRYTYNSLTTPSSTFDFDMEAKTQVLMKQTEILGGYNPAEYQSERIWATAKDGVKVPISLVYKKELVKNGENPTFLYAYGSYGICIDPYFSVSRLSLLDRGFVCAIAHIRGGSEMGRFWYEDGKLLQKLNTFTDFIACGETLIEENFTNPQKLFAMGGSAGGMLMGGIVNMRPDLWRGVVAQVPFVDVVTTMLDDTIPLTTGEYDEWGNPNEEEYYKYMLKYSPYDNLEAKEYPNLLVISGLHDSQVQYFEPTKWVAKLRTLKTDKNLLLLKTNMEAGHGGVSGRFEGLKEVALEYAFFLHLLS